MTPADQARAAAILKGLKPWVADAIRNARPYGASQHIVGVYSGVPDTLTVGYVVAGMGSPLNDLGLAVRQLLIAEAGRASGAS